MLQTTHPSSQRARLPSPRIGASTHRADAGRFILTLAALALAIPEASQRRALPWLRADGLRLADEQGRMVVLRGFSAGGAFVLERWMAAMNLDRSVSDLPEIRDEKSFWDVLTQRFGPEKATTLWRAWRTAWFSVVDVARLAALRCNVVRIPFWHGMLEDEAHPGQLLPEGTQVLDGLLDECARDAVYAILAMHGAPGGQSKEEHTGEVGRNELFKKPELRERTAGVWAAIARHCAARPEVAGYDLLNEPTGAPDAVALIVMHGRLYRAIRAVDRRHIVIFEDGYKGWAALPNPRERGWENVAHSLHLYQFGAKSPAAHERVIAVDLPRYRREQAARSVPLYIGEFSTQTELQGGVTTMAAHFAAFNGYGWSWTPWTFKQVDATDGRRSIWGLYTNDRPWHRANPYHDSFDTLLARFGEYETGYLAVQPAYRDAVLAATGGVPR